MWEREFVSSKPLLFGWDGRKDATPVHASLIYPFLATPLDIFRIEEVQLY